MNVGIYENGLQESRINVCALIRTGERYISKIMVISQVPETLTDFGGAWKIGWQQCMDCTSTKMKDILITYLVILPM